MTSEILDKLNGFLKLHMPFREECHAVYFLIEIRKLLDREKSSTFPILRFYADWSAHTDKDKITSQIRTTMENIYLKIRESVLNKCIDPEEILSPFISMELLRTECHRFLKMYGLPEDLIGEHWSAFQNLLASVLVDQPIHTPCAGIQSFSFIGVARGRAAGQVIYEKKPAEYDSLTFG